MVPFELVEWIALGLVSLTAAAFAVWWLTPRLRGGTSGGAAFPDCAADDPIWVFEGDRLIDSTDAAKSYPGTGRIGPNWSGLRDILGKRFPDFPACQTDAPEGGRMCLASADPDDTGVVSLEWIADITRIHLRNGTSTGREPPVDSASELAVLRNAVDQSPFPSWQITEFGVVSWSNRAYRVLQEKLRPSSDDPQKPLFPLLPSALMRGHAHRMAIIEEESKNKHWFDVTVVANDGGPMCFAVDAGPFVEAETAQRNFVQTLAKTFAQLSIGLVIFDRNRQLALFNPALIDLTALPAEFLTSRPNLLTFFDKLRDQRMMPEPKDYGNWRQRMADLVAAASDGRYQETWSLPSGSVYSVTGRPHPDGAIAFLFEDITAEITLTRRFRSELELGQSILDQLENAVAVFASDGTLTVTNAAYCTMWAVDPDNSFAQTTVIDATRSWQDRCKATPVWGEIRDFVASRENRADWRARVTLLSGNSLVCQVSPIQNGATLVSFAYDPLPASALPADIQGADVEG